MKPRPRGRYKKKKRELILYLKITLICYLAIFGVAYMSSDTSAYLSSQSVITQTITAGIWVPEVPACGEEGLTDQLPGEESELITEDIANQSQEEAVNDAMIGEGIEAVCGDQSDALDIIGESKEVDCKKADAPESTEEVMTDCKVEEVVETEKAAENPEAPAIEEEQAAEDVEAPAVDQEAAEEVKTLATDKEKEEKENTSKNVETSASEKEKEVKTQNESITKEQTVEKNDGVEPAVNESKENEVQNNESLTQPNSND